MPATDLVLITRPEPGATETAARVAALGLRPVVAPLLEIRTLPTRLPPPERIQAVLVASGNALPALIPACRGVTLLAVGDATAMKARAAGFSSVISAGADAQALAELTARACDARARPLLLAAGAGQSLPLAAALRARGFRVLRRVVYRAIPAPALPASARDALTSGQLRAVLFFSADTARQFARLLARAGMRDRVAGAEACAIGTRAASAIERLPWRRVRCAAHPTQDAMLALLT
jgi:uroporphyrinogen-III synthase